VVVVVRRATAVRAVCRSRTSGTRHATQTHPTTPSSSSSSSKVLHIGLVAATAPLLAAAAAAGRP
jgi:hypothetical protein